MLILILRILLTAACLGMFVYAFVAMRGGRVYAKGLYYEREANRLGFWLTIALYVCSPPAILYLAWTAS